MNYPRSPTRRNNGPGKLSPCHDFFYFLQPEWERTEIKLEKGGPILLNISYIEMLGAAVFEIATNSKVFVGFDHPNLFGSLRSLETLELSGSSNITYAGFTKKGTPKISGDDFAANVEIAFIS